MEQLSEFFSHAEERFPELIYVYERADKGHGRLEHRKIEVLDTSNTRLVFPGIKQVARLTRTREIVKSGRQNTEQVFLITNLSFEQIDAERFFNLKRSYWDVENVLHYRKDFTFGEDRSTIRARFGPQNMSSLRNFAVALLLALGIRNVKRCVDNLQHHPYVFLKRAA
jgi:hypothetical protein